MSPVVISLLCLAGCLAGCLAVRPGPTYAPTHGQVWPQPKYLQTKQQLFVYNPELLYFKTQGYCFIVSQAIQRYRVILKRQSLGVVDFFWMTEALSVKNSNPEKINLHTVDINFNGICENIPHEGMKESYNLTVSKEPGTGVVNITSDSVWGVLRALETFSQLSYYNGSMGLLTVREVDIQDEPRFSHRGIMLDTSRHFLPKRIIKKTLEAMEYNKFNIFHWHIVDDQSFPYQSAIYPSLSQKGAYDPVRMIYTESDIQEIINYAGFRGIRVVPEFDTPGHTQSWGPGLENFLTPCFSHSKETGTFGPVDPSNDNNYAILRNLFKEVKDRFASEQLFLGGDEVDFTCWESNENILNFMRKKGFGNDFHKLEAYYNQKVIEITKSLGVTPIVWQEVFMNNENLDNSTLVHIWYGDMKSVLSKVTMAGFKTIVSTCWYLDHFTQNLYAGGGDWENFYKCEPLDFGGSDEQKRLVVGGEACMWGEYVDETNIVARMWPRASAAAERLWSHQWDVKAAASRLEEHVCRMRSRGISAQPPNGPSVCLN